MRLDRVTIPVGPGGDAGAALAGLLYRPREPARSACVVLAHGLTASKASLDLLAAYLCGRGWPCLAFDFRGHALGGSSGRLMHACDVVQDVAAATRFAVQHLRLPRCALVGHSMGGVACLAAAAELEQVEAVAALATGLSASAAFRTQVGRALLTQRSGYVAGAETRVLLGQLDELAARIDWPDGLPALCVASRADVLVPPGAVCALAGRLGSAAEFAEVDGGHDETPARARGVVADWLERATGPTPRT